MKILLIDDVSFSIRSEADSENLTPIQRVAGRRLEQLPDEQQFNPTTSEVEKAIGSTLKLSPVKIDNLIRGYTGTIGMFLAQALDPLAN